MLLYKRLCDINKLILEKNKKNVLLKRKDPFVNNTDYIK